MSKDEGWEEIESTARRELGWSEERTVHFLALGRFVGRLADCHCARRAAPEALRVRIVATIERIGRQEE